jgi:hypothetical protein
VAETRHPVYLELGPKRTFAGALEWPGWCRSGRDEAGALEALASCAGRYAQALEATGLGFALPTDASAFEVVERLPGDSTTDFGAPGAVPQYDRPPMDAAELERARILLAACWGALDDALAAAGDRELTKGPRGGGRSAEAIAEHVVGGEGSYLARIAGRHRDDPSRPMRDRLGGIHDEVLAALTAAVRDGLPESGPRGGAIWPPRYFVRRVAWHALDHAWEIEDRTPT